MGSVLRRPNHVAVVQVIGVERDVPKLVEVFSKRGSPERLATSSPVMRQVEVDLRQLLVLVGHCPGSGIETELSDSGGTRH